MDVLIESTRLLGLFSETAANIWHLHSDQTPTPPALQLHQPRQPRPSVQSDSYTWPRSWSEYRGCNETAACNKWCWGNTWSELRHWSSTSNPPIFQDILIQNVYFICRRLLSEKYIFINEKYFVFFFYFPVFNSAFIQQLDRLSPQIYL